MQLFTGLLLTLALTVLLTIVNTSLIFVPEDFLAGTGTLIALGIQDMTQCFWHRI